MIDLATYLVGISTLLLCASPANGAAAALEHAAAARFWIEGAGRAARAAADRVWWRCFIPGVVFLPVEHFAVLVVPMVLGFATPEALGIGADGGGSRAC